MSTSINAQHVLPGAASGLAALPGPPGAAAGPAAAGFGAGDAWRVIKQRKLLIIVSSVVLYMLVAAATFVVYRYAPLYPGTAMIQVLPPARDWMAIEQGQATRDYVGQTLSTEAARLRSQETLLDLLRQEQVKATKFYRSYPDTSDGFSKCLTDLQDALSVSPVRDSFLLRVSLALSDPIEARDVVNLLVDRFVLASREAETGDKQERLAVLKNTQAAVQAQLTNIQSQIADLRAQQNMPALESERDVLVGNISVLQNTISELQARAADIEQQLASVRGIDPRNLPLTAEMRLIVEADPVLRYYRQQVEALDIQIAIARANLLGDDNRQMRILIGQREQYFQKEGNRREELITDLRERQVEMLRQEAARVRNMMAKLFDQLTARENTQRDLDAAILRFNNLEKEEERLSQELLQVSTATRQAEHQITVERRTGKLSVAGRARAAIMPSRPNFVIYLGGGLVLSLLVGVGLAFLREFTDQTLRTPIDVARYGHMSVLGSIPLLDDEEAELEDIEYATRLAPQSLVAEAFRQIRAHLTFSGPPESQRVLLITSPRPEDGKTTVAVNLAVALAQSNQRVLLIDCNFRRPAVRKLFKGLRTEGLSHVLIGSSTFAKAVAATEIDNLDVLTSGPMPPNPAEMLGSPQMRALLDEARKAYDRVVIDGPPCLLISDALVLATEVDATVLVARAASSAKGAVRRAREQFQRLGVRVVGAVLNGVQARPGGYFRQQYREFYDYVNEEVVPQELHAGLPAPDGETAADDDPFAGLEDEERK